MAWLASIGIGLAGLVLWLWEKNAKSDVEKKLMLSTALAKDLKRQLIVEEDKGVRLEAVIVLLRGDLHGLQDELEKCAVPGSIRERLNKLLASPNRRP
jgi:hypothetical protein